MINVETCDPCGGCVGANGTPKWSVEFGMHLIGIVDGDVLLCVREFVTVRLGSTVSHSEESQVSLERLIRSSAFLLSS